jgi:hypothetical protein
VTAAARSRSWWRSTVSRWKRSGLTAGEFAAREGVSERTLRWWSSALRRGTRAARGSSETAITPIEIEVPRGSAHAGHLEIAIDGAVLRVAVGADVEYVSALVKQLRGAR